MCKKKIFNENRLDIVNLSAKETLVNRVRIYICNLAFEICNIIYYYNFFGRTVLVNKISRLFESYINIVSFNMSNRYNLIIELCSLRCRDYAERKAKKNIFD